MPTSGLTISHIAHAACVNLETIRFYERHGIIDHPPRTSSGYRQYPPDTIQRVKFIKHAQALGFSLKEIKELLDMRVNPEMDCGDVKTLAEKKIREIDKKIADMRKMRDALQRISDSCHGVGPTSQCPILTAIEGES